MELYSTHVITIIILSLIHVCDTAIFGGLGIAGAIALGGAGYQWGTCLVKECCTDKWTRPDDKSIGQILRLFDNNLFGQHLVMKIVPKAVYYHITNKDPSKALVMSFHGWTGSGKNFVANLISRYLYRQGMNSAYRHLKIASEHYYNASDVDNYKKQLHDFVVSETKKCGRSLFIFDEMDKMPPHVTDVLKPFLDHYPHVDGVDYRKNIFIFLNNVGGNEINQVAMENFKAGKKREEITSSAMEKILSLFALKEQGGFKDAELIISSVIDHFIPFLPMERLHVEQCALAEIEKRTIERKEEDPLWDAELDAEEKKNIIDSTVDEIQFYPSGQDIFAKSGCKQVSKKLDMFL